MKKVLFSALLLMISGMAMSQKFAVVDSDYILESITEYQNAKEQLDQLSADWQKEIETKFAEIDKMYKDYQAQAVLLPEEMKKKKEDEIINKEKEVKNLQKQRFGKDGDLFKKRQELVKPIQDKVYNAIEEISTEAGYSIVFDKAGGLTMLYVSTKVDISDDIIEKMGYRPKTKK